MIREGFERDDADRLGIGLDLPGDLDRAIMLGAQREMRLEAIQRVKPAKAAMRARVSASGFSTRCVSPFRFITESGSV